MSTFDLLLLLPVAYGAFKGFRGGLIQELASLAAFVLLTVFGVKLMELARPLVREWLGETAGFLPFIPYLLVFVGIEFAVRFTGRLLRKAVHMTPFGSLDTLGGAVLGATKWAFAICLLVYFAHRSGLDTALQAVRDSDVYPLYLGAAPSAWAFVQWVVPIGKDALASLQ